MTKYGIHEFILILINVTRDLFNVAISHESKAHFWNITPLISLSLMSVLIFRSDQRFLNVTGH